MARAAATLFSLLFGLVIACGDAPTPSSGARDSKNKPTPGSSSSSGGTEDPSGGDPSSPSSGSTSTGSCGDAPTAPVDTTTLDPFFTSKMQAANVPGLSVAVIGGGRIKWAKGYGLANIADNKPVTPATVFMLASISKTITAVAMMQLIEDPARGLSLDQDINDKLPFSVRNPSFPNTPITYRMLLTHTSSLIDSDAYWAVAEPEPMHQGDSPTPLLDFDRTYVAQSDSWSSSAPGTVYTYSNTASSIVGLLVETISGKNLQDYAQANIFDRLGMKESSFFLRNLDPSHIAMPYDGGPPFKATGHYGYPDYPDGQMRTSAPQLARFLMMFAQKGQCGQQRVLKEATVDAMRTVQNAAIEPSQGLVWFYRTLGGTKVLGHDGADKGVSTDMFFDPQTGSGYVLLMNGSTTTGGVASQQAAMAAMDEKLLELAKTLP